MTSPIGGGSEHISRYRALGEFDSLIRAAREAKRALQELREEEAKLNAQSLADDKALTASKQARTKAEKENTDSAKKALTELNKGDPAGKSGEDAGTSYSRGVGRGIEKNTQSGENRRFVDAATTALSKAFADAGNDSGNKFSEAFSKRAGDQLRPGAGGSGGRFDAAVKAVQDALGKSGETAGEKFTSNFNAKVRGINKDLTFLRLDSLNLDVHTKDAEQEIAALEFELKKLAHDNPDIVIRVVSNRALADIKSVSRSLRDELGEEAVKDAERIRKELDKIDALPSGKSFQFWALTALSDMSKVFEEADRGASVFTKLRTAIASSGGGGGGSIFKGFISGFDDFSESSSNLLKKLGNVSGELIRMPGLIGVLVAAIPALISGLGAIGGAGLGVVSALGSLSGLLAAAPAGFIALGTSTFALKSAFGGLGDALKQAKQAHEQELQAKEKSRLGTEKALTANQKLQVTLNDLSPATEKVTRSIIDLGDKWQDSQKKIGENFFKQVANDTGRLNQLLPIAQNLLGGAATALGKVADQGIKMITSGPWKKDFATIAKNNATIITNMGGAGLALANVFRNIAVAAGPFTTWITKSIKEAASAFSDWSSRARSDGSIGKFLAQTEFALQSVWTIVKNLGSAVNSLFQSTVDQGQTYLRSLADITGKWKDVAKAQEQANSPLKEWMQNIRPVISALGGLIGDVVKGIANLASNQNNLSNMLNLIDSLRTKILPPILDILQHLNDSGIAETVVKALGSLLDAISRFLDSGATNALTVFVGVLSEFAQLLLNIASLPGVSNVLGAVASALSALAAVSIVARFTGLFKLWDFFTWMIKNKGNLSGAFSDAARGVAGLSSKNNTGTPARAVPSPIGGIGSEIVNAGAASEIDKIAKSSENATGKVGIFSGALSGISRAGGFAKGALGGLVGFLGGPWGVALTAAGIGVGLLANHLASQKQDAEDTKNAFIALKNAYSDLSQGNTENLKSLADTDGKLKDVINQATQYGLSLTDVSGALNDQEQSLSRFNAQIDVQINALKAQKEAAEENLRVNGQASVLSQAQISVYDDQIKKAEDYKNQVNNTASAQENQNKILQDSIATSRTYSERLAGMTDAQVQTAVASGDLDTKIQSLSHALDTMSSASSTSSDRSKALSDIINVQYGATKNAIEGTQTWSSALINFKDTLAQSKSELGKHEDALSLNSKAGLRNRDALEQAATSARDLYLQDIASGKPMDEATKKHDQRIKALKDEAEKAGLSKKETEKLIAAYGDVPTNVKTNISTNNYRQVYDQMQRLKMFQAALQEGLSLDDAQKEVDNSIARANAHGYNYATGGRVVGPGTKTSDSIQAWLSNGEFVQPTDAVDYYGLPLMEAIRTRSLDKKTAEALLGPNSEIEGYASGGHAHSNSCPSCATGGHKLNFATGGSVSWPFPVDLAKTLVKKQWADTVADGAVPGGGQFTPGYQNQLNILHRAGFQFHPTVGQTYGGTHAPNSWHYRGRAVDLSPPNDRAWQFLVKNYAKTSKELFWASKAVNYRHGQATGPHDKTNHIHWAYNQGGLVDLMSQLGMDNLAPQSQNAPLPSTPRTLSPAASSVVNSSTDNTTSFGDVIINNPLPERAGDSVRDALYRTSLLY